LSLFPGDITEEAEVVLRKIEEPSEDCVHGGRFARKLCKKLKFGTHFQNLTKEELIILRRNIKLTTVPVVCALVGNACNKKYKVKTNGRIIECKPHSKRTQMNQLLVQLVSDLAEAAFQLLCEVSKQ